MSDTSDKDTRRVFELAEKLDFCMFVTTPASGPRSRPMSSIVKPAEGAIYFLSARDNLVDDELATHPSVNLAYADGNSFLSVTGKAEIIEDIAVIRALWNPGAQAFWPEGPDAGKAVALRVQPEQAQFWEGSGRVMSAVKFAVALATGTTPSMGKEKKVAFG